MQSKKLITDCCRDNDDRATINTNKFNNDEWQDWLSTIRVFFSSYFITTVFNNNSSNDLRPYAAIRVGNTKLCGLLDSGSTVSILGNNSHVNLTSLGLKIHPDTSKTFTAAGGEQLPAVGYVFLPINFENQFRILKTYIVPSVSLNLILGFDFWTKFNLFPKYHNSISLRNNISDLNVASITDEPTGKLRSYLELTEPQRVTADNIIDQFRNVSTEVRGLGRTNLIEHRIDTGDAQPIRQRYYRVSPEKQRILSEQLDEMLALGVVEECESPWSSPVLLTPKKDGKLRFCLDSRKLNSVTRKDAYKLPYMSEILDNLKDAKYLTSIDLSKAFWQIPIAENDRDKTAFYIPRRGTFRFVTMPFGLTNSPATQQRLVDTLFQGPEFENSVFVYIDDIIITSSKYENHISLLLKVHKKLSLANLSINFDKSVFFRSELKYLGYVVDSKGLHVDPTKIDSIVNYPTPTNKKEIKRFLGIASWYRKFVPQFSTISGPLNKLTSTSKKRNPFVWSAEADECFTKLKELLVSAPILSCPNFDLPFEVHTDASNYGVGGLLTQTIDGVEHPIAYTSRTLTGAEKNYSITEREALAVLFALEHWRCYLDNGKKFVVYTDHSALKWFLNLNNPTGRLARWGVRLSAFNFEIKHRRGSDNVIPDALSRACQIAAIDNTPTNTSASAPSTSDQWYLNVWHGCQNSPASFPNFQVKNGRLFRFTQAKYALQKDFEWKEVIPTEFRHDILLQNHSEPTAGHMGIFKTFKRLSQRYYWPGMHADVVKFVSGCDTCIAHKHQNHAPLGEMGRPKHCSRPFQTVSVDLVGPLPTTRKLNSYILVVTCCFSKYCLLFPIKRATAEIVTKILEDQVFLIHGIPSTVILDNGKQFVSATLKNMLEKYKVPKLHFTPKYSPHINTVERYNKTIMTAISTFISTDQRVWDTLVPKIQFAVNSSVNEVTGFTPSFLVYGRELVACGSYYNDAENDNDLIFQPRDHYAETKGTLSNIFANVQSRLLQAHTRNCAQYNLRRKPADFQVGDVVWSRTFYQSDKDKYFNKKLAPKFVKSKIIHKKSPLVYELQDMNGKRLGTYHIKDIKLTNYKI